MDIQNQAFRIPQKYLWQLAFYFFFCQSTALGYSIIVLSTELHSSFNLIMHSLFIGWLTLASMYIFRLGWSLRGYSLHLSGDWVMRYKFGEIKARVRLTDFYTIRFNKRMGRFEFIQSYDLISHSRNDVVWMPYGMNNAENVLKHLISRCDLSYSTSLPVTSVRNSLLRRTHIAFGVFICSGFVTLSVLTAIGAHIIMQDKATMSIQILMGFILLYCTIYLLSRTISEIFFDGKTLVVKYLLRSNEIKLSDMMEIHMELESGNRNDPFSIIIEKNNGQKVYLRDTGADAFQLWFALGRFIRNRA